MPSESNLFKLAKTLYVNLMWLTGLRISAVSGWRAEEAFYMCAMHAWQLYRVQVPNEPSWQESLVDAKCLSVRIYLKEA